MGARSGKTGLLRRLGNDRRGVTAVEFAMLAPLLILFYFGLAEFCQGFMAQKRMGRTAATVADLVAQADVVNRAEVADIFEVGDLMMRPFPTTPLRQMVTSVTAGTDGVVRVDWSQADGLTPRERDQPVVIPAGLITAGESLVMTEIQYDYESALGLVLPGLTQFSHNYYLRPRRSARVNCTDC